MKLSTSCLFLLACGIFACTPAPQGEGSADASSKEAIEPDYTLTKDQTHNKFSRAIPPVIRVPSGSVIEIYTEEASDEQFAVDSEADAVTNLDFDPIHPLTGPIYIEDAAPGDVLKVTLLEVDLVSWGWTAIAPGFGFLADEFTEPYLKTFWLTENQKQVYFNEETIIPLNPFPGVIGVAPDTDEMLSTIPPRKNGGNMDDPHLVEGTTVYLPVLVPGALLSLGDGHAAQGMGEVCGTAIEVPLRILCRVDLIKGGRSIPEPEYETEDTYAVTAFATTLDEAARQAVRYMIDYLVAEHGFDRADAYALCSLAGDLRIAEVVDVPHVLVSMHMSKSVIGL